jgi:putative ABC transport system permease protein
MRFAWEDFWRDLKGGELTLLLLALVLAVTATTTLRHFSSGIEKGLEREAARLIGADLVIRSSRPVADLAQKTAQDQRLKTASTLEFASVLQGKDTFQLAAIKAVSSHYPLRGQLRLRVGDKEEVTARTPAPGTVWLDERLLGLLQVQPGDSLTLGEKSFRIDAILAYEPDRGGNFSAFSPRALIAIEDVAATGIIQPGSRLQYQLMITGNESQLSDFRKWVEPRIGPSERILDVSSGRPEMASPLKRASDYLGLAAIAAVVLAGLAIAVSIRRFAERRYDFIALLRCLGASRNEALRRVLGELVVIWLIAILAGAILGAIASYAIALILADILPAGLPALSFWHPLLTGVGTATLVLMGFALPALLALGQITPLRVLRRELLPPSLPQLAITVLSLLALFALLAIETGRLMLTAIAIGGGAVLVLSLNLALRYLLNSLRHTGNSSLAALRRNPSETATQMLGLALGLTALLLVVSLRDELLNTWQTKIPVDAPNQFALNIADHELDGFRGALQQAGLHYSDIYPVVRGRLTAINNKPVQTAVSKENPDEVRDESLNRELNLTWAKDLPHGNTLSSGQWWTKDSAINKEVSVEKRLAERLNIQMGDTLTFTLAEGTLQAKVGSLREVDWDSFQPNFYVVFPPGVIEHFPASWMTSFNVPKAKRPALNDLVKAFPTVVLIDIASVLVEVRSLLAQVSQAVEAILLFVLAAGLLVIVAHVSASLDARRFEAALLRVFGASKGDLQRRLLTEFILLGAASGLLAAIMAEILAAMIYWKVFELPPVLHPALWWQAPLAGAVMVSLTGLAGARKIWATSPMLTLRRP